MEYSQSERLISIETPLGQDKLLLQSFTGTDGISSLFRFQLDLLSEDAGIDFKKIIGQNVTLRVTQFNGEPRYINGIISQFYQGARDGELTKYRAEMVPWLWLLTRNADCRIFQNMTVPEIIADVCRRNTFSSFEDQTQESYEPREFCVQYRETDYNFISRLMEQYGIFYFFTHKRGIHSLVLADRNSIFTPLPSEAEVSLSDNSAFGGDRIVAWQIGEELKTGKYSLNDYNFITPSSSLLASEATIVRHTGPPSELYDYPGEYDNKSQGRSIATVRMQEEESTSNIANGSGTCRAFGSGYTFVLSGSYRHDLNQEYLLTQVSHIATVGDSYLVKGLPSASYYENHFTCIPKSVPFRPLRTSPKPNVTGVQTAKVVGPAGEELWVDKFGRVKVQFPWDRLGTSNENSSCWIRVSQGWAGAQWGSIYHPRIGQEVVVAFLEGDPDRPLITGSVYNAEQMPPYDLPDKATQSGVKSRSTKGAGSSNFNEIRLEDSKGKEQMVLHAEREMDISVEADQIITVGGDRHITTGGIDQAGNKSGSVRELVFLDHNLQVKTDSRMKIEGDSSHHVQGNSNALYDKDLVKGVTGKCVVIADTIHLQGKTKIVLMAGNSSLVIDASGVTVLGSPLINLNSPGAPPPPELAPSVVDPELP